MLIFIKRKRDLDKEKRRIQGEISKYTQKAEDIANLRIPPPPTQLSKPQSNTTTSVLQTTGGVCMLFRDKWFFQSPSSGQCTPLEKIPISPFVYSEPGTEKDTYTQRIVYDAFVLRYGGKYLKSYYGKLALLQDSENISDDAFLRYVLILFKNKDGILEQIHTNSMNLGNMNKGTTSNLIKLWDDRNTTSCIKKCEGDKFCVMKVDKSKASAECERWTLP
jgi:hypothetical protein